MKINYLLKKRKVRQRRAGNTETAKKKAKAESATQMKSKATPFR
jgi:hypothetical protein